MGIFIDCEEELRGDRSEDARQESRKIPGGTGTGSRPASPGDFWAVPGPARAPCDCELLTIGNCLRDAGRAKIHASIYIYI